MNYQDPNPGGRLGGALPGLTSGIKILLIANAVGFLFNNLLTVGHYRTFLGLSLDGMLDGYGLGLLRVLSYQFIHDLSLGHIVWNMLMLYFFGTMVEGRGEGFGTSGYYLDRGGVIRLYLACGAVGGLLYSVLGAMWGDAKTPVIGASGAVYGIMMYAACIEPRRQIHLIFVSVEIRFLVGFLVFVGLYYSYLGLVHGGSGDGVAHSAHLGGALWGFVAHRLARRGIVSDTGPLARLRRWREAAQRRSAQRSREALDRILDKVHREGLSGLSAAERRFLEKASKDARK